MADQFTDDPFLQDLERGAIAQDPFLQELMGTPEGATPTGPQVPIAGSDPTLQALHEQGLAARGLTQKPDEPTPPGLAQRAAGIPMAGYERLVGQDVPPGDRWAEMSRQSAVGVLALLGAHAGSMLPTAPGPAGIVINPITGTIVGGTAGAGVGALAPEWGMETAEMFGLVPPGTTEKYGRPWSERVKIAKGEMALDVTMGVAGQMFRLAIGRPLSNMVTGPSKPGPGGIKGTDLANRASQELGITLMPWQTGGRSLARAALAVGGRFPLVGAPARKAPTIGRPWRSTVGQATVEKQAIKYMEEFPGKAGRGEVRMPYDLSASIFEDAKGLHQEFMNYFGRKYDALWDVADRSGVRVRLSNLQGTGQRIIDQIGARAATEGGAPSVKADRQAVINWITENIMNRDPVQRLRGLDTMIDEIGDQYLKQETKENRFLQGKLNELRSAAVADLSESVFDFERAGPIGGMSAENMPSTTRRAEGVAPGAPAPLDRPLGPRTDPLGGPTMEGMRTGDDAYTAVDAKTIAQEIRALDQQYSNVISTFFETSTAKKFARVERQGLRGMTWDPVTSTPLGKLSEITMDMENPNVVDELFSLMRPETQRDTLTSVLEEGMKGSWKQAKEGFGQTGLVFDTEHFLEFFGLTPDKAARGKVLERMMDMTGSPLKMDTVRLLGQALDTIALTSLPSASSFMARRAQIGGAKAVVAGMLGGLAGSGGGYAIGEVKGAVLGMAISFLGARGFVRAISNPAGARALKNVLSEEANLGKTRANWYRLIRWGIGEWVDSARSTGAKEEDVARFRDRANEFESAVSEQLRQLQDVQQNKRRG